MFLLQFLKLNLCAYSVIWIQTVFPSYFFISLLSYQCIGQLVHQWRRHSVQALSVTAMALPFIFGFLTTQFSIVRKQNAKRCKCVFQLLSFVFDVVSCFLFFSSKSSLKSSDDSVSKESFTLPVPLNYRDAVLSDKRLVLV